jgi:translation elongation factor EF-1beta
MIDYQKTKIFKLVSPKTDEVYIGATTRRLSQRLTELKNNYKKNKHHTPEGYRVFGTGIDDVSIQLLELFPCNSIEEVNARVQRHQILYFHENDETDPDKDAEKYINSDSDEIIEYTEYNSEIDEDIPNAPSKKYNRVEKEVKSVVKGVHTKEMNEAEIKFNLNETQIMLLLSERSKLLKRIRELKTKPGKRSRHMIDKYEGQIIDHDMKLEELGLMDYVCEYFTTK